MLVKFCGMRRQEDLDLASRLGVNFCGFIFHPRSPRHIDPATAGRLHTGAMKRVGVFVKQDAAEICAIMRMGRLDMAQLHGRQDEECARSIGSARVIRVLWPARHQTVDSLVAEARRFGPTCAMYLLDAGQSGGGSGATLDWTALATLELPHPFILAGGLNAGNAALACAQCTPAGLDFNSGIEDAPGIKNRELMLAAAKSAGVLPHNL